MVWGKVMKTDEKTCPRCKATIKKIAHLCKNCGHPFSEAEIEAGQKETQGETKTLVVSIVVVVSVLAFAVNSCLPESTNKAAQPVADIEASKSPYADVGKQGLWIVTSQDAIRARLKDPDSAEFRNVRFYSGGSTPVACGEVNAKNGFGGKSGYERFIAAGSNLAILASDMKSSSEMNEVWAKMCVKSSTDEA